MAQLSSDELSQSMQYALKEVADLTKEIGHMSMNIVTKLHRPPIDTSEQVILLMNETLTVFITIGRKVIRVQEIMKTNLQCYSSMLETREPDGTAKNFSIRDEPQSTHNKSLSAVAPFSVKLPTKPQAKMSAQPPLFTLSSPKHASPKTPIQLSSLPPRLPVNYDKVIVREDIKTDDVQHTPFNGKDLDSASFSSSLSSRMGSTILNPPGLDLERQLTVQTQDVVDFQASEPNAEDDSYLMEWMAQQHYTEGADEADFYKWLTQVLCDEFVACMKRGLQLVDFFKQSQCEPVGGMGLIPFCALTRLQACIEELANFEVMHGNIAVTTFGSQPKVALHLTNDYTQARNVIDSLVAEGPSTLYRGLSMAIAACIANYANVVVNDVRLMARVIVLTDGKFSAEDAKDENYELDQRNAILVPFAANLLKLNGIVCYCVHIGEPADSVCPETVK
ncbi:uncharacterized protein LOC110454971 [Mizuhopecten yessoensis]|uniref:uncharacterized protein LOC110454971 n=1 Tax=Mizuhopecten yessoensis TaxID=6573 RepID=UPI000B45CB29|nr:uncharacterized protein LOC110454971 [Mizuhopecten yessoensis]